MALSEKEKKRYVAIMRAMKEQKGFVSKQSEFQTDIAQHKEAIKKTEEVKKQYGHCPTVVEKAELQKKKLQTIIDDLNEYMRILHPEGLLDMGSGNSGAVVSQG